MVKLIAYFHRHLDAARSGLCHSQKLHIYSSATHRCRHSESRSRPSTLGMGYWEAETKERLSSYSPENKTRRNLHSRVTKWLTFLDGYLCTTEAGNRCRPKSPYSKTLL